ncbi:MAG: CapA family protein [Helicobacteraceae bacterium]|jgi:hypothetical protein|nr:CapA family protein [Helicobacteraceae bacterium]
MRIANLFLFLTLTIFISACSVSPKIETLYEPIAKRGETKIKTVNKNAIVVAAVGDIMIGTDYPDKSLLPPDDGKSMFAEVKPILQAADLTIGNLEGAMIDGGETRKCRYSVSLRCFTFRMPMRYAALLKEAGFNAMNLANNHSYDFGEQGAASARRALDEQNISHTGEIGDIARLIINNFNVSIIGFAPNANLHSINDLNLTANLVSQEAKVADFVIVVFHGGAEGGDKIHTIRGHEFHWGEDRGDPIAFAHIAIDAGADLVVGHGPHVPRGMEIYKDRLIAYSLGNFATWEMMNLSGFRGLAPILEVTLASDGTFTRGKIHSAIQVKPGGPRIDPTNAAANLMRDLSIEDFGDSAPVFTNDDEILPIAPNTSAICN